MSQNPLEAVINEISISNADILSKLNLFFLRINNFNADELISSYQAIEAYMSSLSLMGQKLSPTYDLAQKIQKAILQRMKFVARAQLAIVDGKNYRVLFSEVSGDESF